jgi:hypothetical protein
MSKEQFEKISVNFWQKMKDENVQGIMKYKPFSDDYWNQKNKIVICNYECIGFQDSQDNNVTFSGFRGWIAAKKTKTIHYTAVFTNTLIKLLNGETYTLSDMRNSYKKIDELHKSMENVMFMNLRPTSASGSNQEINKTHQLVKKYKAELKEYIEALDADIFVLSSKDSAMLFNFIFDIKENPLIFKKNKRLGNTLIFSIKHFGRFFNYKYYYEKAVEIVYIWRHL